MFSGITSEGQTPLSLSTYTESNSLICAIILRIVSLLLMLHHTVIILFLDSLLLTCKPNRLEPRDYMLTAHL